MIWFALKRYRLMFADLRWYGIHEWDAHLLSIGVGDSEVMFDIITKMEEL